MVIGVEPCLADGGVGGLPVIQGLEVGGGEEDEGVGVVVGLGAGFDHPEVVMEGEGGVVPTSGEAADHDVEGEVVGVGDLGEEEGGVGEIFEVHDELGEEVVGLVDEGGEHVGVDLLEGIQGIASFQEGQDAVVVVVVMMRLLVSSSWGGVGWKGWREGQEGRRFGFRDFGF